MVLWCKCGAFMGLREPFGDWSLDRTGVCPDCARESVNADEHAEKGIPSHPVEPSVKPEDSRVRL